jgi:hypothetical protein
VDNSFGSRPYLRPVFFARYQHDRTENLEVKQKRIHPMPGAIRETSEKEFFSQLPSVIKS